MAQLYFQTGRHNEPVVFDYFFRKLPFHGGYVTFAGLESLLEILSGLKFTQDDLEYLLSIGFEKDFIAYLKNFRFQGNIFAVKEGEVVFPTETLLRAEGNLLETQLIETLVLNIINYQSLVATKASRMRWAAGNRILSESGLRRAQGLAGYHATRASIIGGFNSTSHVKAAKDFNIKPSGTMAHAFIQSYDDELTAFREFVAHNSKDCVLLVDTYNTLESGLPHAMIVAKEMEKKGQKLLGVRLDSGDLAYLSKVVRNRLDQENLHDVKIVVSNQLDEYVIKSLMEQHAPIDIFGVGTNLVTCPPDAALDGVYKLSFLHGIPKIKLSETLQKVTLPHRKNVFRMVNEDGTFFGADVVTLDEEQSVTRMHHPFEPEKSISLKGLGHESLLSQVMKNGQWTQPGRNLEEIATYAQHRLSLLPAEHKRFENPHTYKIGLSKKLFQLRNDLRKNINSRKV